MRAQRSIFRPLCPGQALRTSCSDGHPDQWPIILYLHIACNHTSGVSALSDCIHCKCTLFHRRAAISRNREDHGTAHRLYHTRQTGVWVHTVRVSFRDMIQQHAVWCARTCRHSYPVCSYGHYACCASSSHEVQETRLR